MKKLLSITAAGLVIMAIAGSAFAASSANTAPQTSNKHQMAFEHHRGHMGKMVKCVDQELLSLLKLDEAALTQKLQEGKSLAEIATAQGIEPQKVIDLMAKQASERLDQAVQAGKLTQAQADEKKAHLQEQITNLVENKGGFKFGKHGRHDHRGGHIEDVASIVGMDEQEVITQLQSGKTLAQIAQEKGISKDSLINQLLQKEKERLTQIVDQTRHKQQTN